MKNKMYLEDIPKKGSLINWKNSVGMSVKFSYEGDEGFLKIVNYKGGNRPILDVEYKGVISSIDTTNFKNCNIGIVIGKIRYKYAYDVGDIIKEEKRNISIIKKYRNLKNRKTYDYICNNCGNIDKIIETEIVRGVGCNVCCNPPKKVLVGYNDVMTTNPYVASLMKNNEDKYKYTQNSNKKVSFICPKCRNEKICSVNEVTEKGFSCNACGDGFSYPEKFIANILNQLGIKFKQRKKFKWSNNKEYDFYLSEIDTIIEVHGRQHYENTLRGRSLQEERDNDIIKEIKAIRNGMKNYITIDARNSDIDWIKSNILKSKMNTIFDLSNIDWVKCDSMSNSSIMVEACKLKFENPNMTTKEIANIIGKSRGTIANYLKRGHKLGLCYYNEKDEYNRGIRKNEGSNRKKVLVVETGDIFNSVNELARISFEKYGERFTPASISRICNNLRNTCYKYNFKFID